MSLIENEEESGEEPQFSLNKIEINPDSVFEIESSIDAANGNDKSKIKSKLAGLNSSNDKIWIYEKGKLL